jgi:hypothetical protein
MTPTPPAPPAAAELLAFQHKTYRVEWQVQRGEVDQYGLNFKAYATDPFPTREEAAAFLPTVANKLERLDRWIPKDAPHGYCEARIIYREVEVQSRPAAPLPPDLPREMADIADETDISPGNYKPRVPDFLIWHCAGCGAAAEGKKKPCDCATNVGTRTGPNGKREQTWWDDPSVDERAALLSTVARLTARVAELERDNTELRTSRAAWKAVAEQQSAAAKGEQP